MGLDLALLPFEGKNSSYSILNLFRDSELFDELLKLEKKEVPKPFHSYLCRNKDFDGESHFGDTRETPYGDKVYYLTVEELLGVAGHRGVREYWKNKAIWSYLMHCPEEMKVGLFWS